MTMMMMVMMMVMMMMMMVMMMMMMMMMMTTNVNRFFSSHLAANVQGRNFNAREDVAFHLHNFLV